MRSSLSKAARALVPKQIRDLLGKPPLLADEDAKQYDNLLVELAGDVKPKDFIEWLWLKDIVDLTWDILRYRRIKAAYVGHCQWAGIEHCFKFPLNLPSEKARSLAYKSMSDPEMKEQVEAVLSSQGFDPNSIRADSFVRAIDKLDSLERMIASAELRRNNALREIERRRADLGIARRRTSDQVIEGEVSLVPAAAE